MKSLEEIKVSIPEIIPNSYVRMLGSSNGLVCVSYPSERQRNVVSLWNPVTRRFQRLLETSCEYVVFGYSPPLDDYKVIMIYRPFNRILPSFPYLKFVYSSKTGSFTIVDGHRIYCMFFEHDYSVLVGQEVDGN